MGVIKYFLMLLAFVIMSMTVLYIDSVSVIDSMAFSFVVVLSGFLGVDMASMIKSTSGMKNGEFKPMNVPRYVVGFFAMGILFFITIFRMSPDLPIQAAAGSFGSGSLIIIGLLLGGLQGNKIATDGLKAGGPDV